MGKPTTSKRTEQTRRAPRKRRLPQHYAAAYREAGHAVAAWQRGVMLMPLSIFTVSKQAGRNVWDDPLRNVDFEWVRTSGSPTLALRVAAILLAGPAAETLFGPRLPKGSRSIERLRDARSLLRAASSGDAAQGRVRFAEARAETKRFLERPRVTSAVNALAAALVRRGTIRGGEAASIIESHLDV